MAKTNQPSGVHRPTSRRMVLRGAMATGGAATLGVAGTDPAAAADGRADKSHGRVSGQNHEQPQEGQDSTGPRGGGPRIGVLLYDGYSLLDPTGPAEVLSRLPGVSVTMVAERRGPVRTDTGQVAVLAERSLDEVGALDVLLVPGGGERGTTGALENPRLLDWIRRTDRHTRWTTSVCTGSLVLGAAGLLRGRPATTYWSSQRALAEYGARYVAERYVRSGKFVTAAGVSAGVDMALFLAARLAGETVAQAIQLAIEYDPQPPYDTGSPERATPELRELALRLLSESQRPTGGRRVG